MKIDFYSLRDKESRIELLSWFDLQHRKINGIDLHARHQLRMATLCAGFASGRVHSSSNAFPEPESKEEHLSDATSANGNGNGLRQQPSK